MLKISKKGLKTLAVFALPIIKYAGKKTIDNVIEKNNEKLKQEKLYNDEKHSKFIKVLSIILLMISSLFTTIAIKNSEIIAGIIGLLAITFIGYAYLLCLEILKEQIKNIYKVMLSIGLMLLVIVVSFLYF